MKHSGKIIALTTALALTLSGCSALLERDYSQVTPHNTAPTTDGDPSILRADSYQELVNALIYLVGTGAETGTIRLYLDADQVESGLEAACLEVVQEDPLGAYAVEYIKYSVNSVVTYFEAQVELTYRRTREQVASIVQATGVTAIRSELSAVLSTFQPECVLRISYFDEDETFIRDLAQQAYYSIPTAALGMPDIQVSIYPDQGRQRIVEIVLTYSQETAELERQKAELERWTEQLSEPLAYLEGDEQIAGAIRAILDTGVYDPEGGSTAYALLRDGLADSEGLALALSALLQRLEVSCLMAQGTVDGQEHFWLVVQTEGGWRHLDLSAPEEGGPLYTDRQLLDLGYAWKSDNLPACTAQDEDAE